MSQTEIKMYQRWDIHQRIQHWLMVSSFILVSITGIPIKFAYTSWAQIYAGVFGNFEILFAIHKIGALIMIMSALHHLFYLIIKAIQGKLRWTMMPVIKDFKDFFQNIGYFCGLAKCKAKFSKYSYKEKMDYWAVYWGTPIMVISGLVLWFPGVAASLMPLWIIESSHFLHQDEGMLAILFIFSIHFYNVHFSPDFFPMNFTWLTGKVSQELMEDEYPLELSRIKEEGTNGYDREIPQKPTLAN